MYTMIHVAYSVCAGAWYLFFYIVASMYFQDFKNPESSTESSLDTIAIVGKNRGSEATNCALNFGSVAPITHVKLDQ